MADVLFSIIYFWSRLDWKALSNFVDDTSNVVFDGSKVKFQVCLIIIRKSEILPVFQILIFESGTCLEFSGNSLIVVILGNWTLQTDLSMKFTFSFKNANLWKVSFSQFKYYCCCCHLNNSDYERWIYWSAQNSKSESTGKAHLELNIQTFFRLLRKLIFYHLPSISLQLLHTISLWMPWIMQQHLS